MVGSAPPNAEQGDQANRALIDQLIAATRLYNSSKAVHELFGFIVRLREFAPFNAMLLHIQKPGLTHAATARDWWSRFDCAPKSGARPLLVLRAMGPADFVFDVLDVEGDDVPLEAFSFPTFGDLTEDRFRKFMSRVARERTIIKELDAEDSVACWIEPVSRSNAPTAKTATDLPITAVIPRQPGS